MRELARSMIRFSWVVPLLGMNQMAKVLTPGGDRGPLESATETFESLSDVAYRQMGPRLREIYDQGDRLQRGVVDAMFGVMDPMDLASKMGLGGGSSAGPAPKPYKPASSAKPAASAPAASPPPASSSASSSAPSSSPSTGGPQDQLGWGPVPAQ